MNEQKKKIEEEFDNRFGDMAEKDVIHLADFKSFLFSTIDRIFEEKAEEIKKELENVLRVCDTADCYHIGIAKVINEKLEAQEIIRGKEEKL